MNRRDEPDDVDAASVKGRLASGFAWQGFTKAFVQSVSWASTIIVARILDPSDYGLMASAGVFTGLLALICETGLAQGLVQKRATTREEQDSLFYLSLLIGGASYGLIFLAAPAIAAFYGMPPLTGILRVGGLSLLLGTVKTVPLAVAMRRMDFRVRALIEMGATLLIAVTVLSMAVNGFGVWSLVYGSIAGAAVTALAYLAYLGRVPTPRIVVRGITEVLGFGVKVTASSMLFFVWSRSDALIIGKVLGERLLGFYSMGMEFALLPLDKIGSIFGQVAFPSMSRLQDNPEDSRGIFIELHRYLLVMTYPVFVGLVFVADEAVSVLLTDKWAPIVPILQVLCMVNMLRISVTLMPPVLNARGRPGLALRHGINSVILLPLGFLIGTRYGMNGVLAAWVIAYPLLYALICRYTLRNLELSVWTYLGSFREAATCTAIMSAALWALETAMGSQPAAVRLVADIAVGVAAYAGALVLLFPHRIATIRRYLPAPVGTRGRSE